MQVLEAIKCSVCGVEQHRDQFFKAMWKGRTTPVCHPCRKAKKSPVIGVHRFIQVQPRRRELTRKATPAEVRLMQGFALLWEGKGINWEFQKPIGPFFADFAVPASRVVVEVDGGYHLDVMQKIRDAGRTKYLEDHGWEVLRFTNEEVSNRLAYVVTEISRKIGVAC